MGDKSRQMKEEKDSQEAGERSGEKTRLSILWRTQDAPDSLFPVCGRQHILPACRGSQLILAAASNELSITSGWCSGSDVDPPLNPGWSSHRRIWHQVLDQRNTWAMLTRPEPWPWPCSHIGGWTSAFITLHQQINRKQKLCPINLNFLYGLEGRQEEVHSTYLLKYCVCIQFTQVNTVRQQPPTPDTHSEKHRSPPPPTHTQKNTATPPTHTQKNTEAPHHQTSG